MFVTDDIEVTVTSGPQPGDSSGLNLIGLSVGVLVVCVVVLIIVATSFLAILVVRRKKGNVRTFQSEGLSRLATSMCATCVLKEKLQIFSKSR